MIKFRKKDKITVYAVETFCKSALQDGTPWEHGSLTIYYLNNTTKRVYEEYGLEFKGHFYDWPSKTSSRSIADLERKYHSDYERFKHILGHFEIQVAKIGEL